MLSAEKKISFCLRCDLSEYFDPILILKIEHFKYMAVHGTALSACALWSISFLDLLHHGQFVFIFIFIFILLSAHLYWMFRYDTELHYKLLYRKHG